MKNKILHTSDAASRTSPSDYFSIIYDVTIGICSLFFKIRETQQKLPIPSPTGNGR